LWLWFLFHEAHLSGGNNTPAKEFIPSPNRTTRNGGGTSGAIAPYLETSLTMSAYVGRGGPYLTFRVTFFFNFLIEQLGHPEHRPPEAISVLLKTVL